MSEIIEVRCVDIYNGSSSDLCVSYEVSNFITLPAFGFVVGVFVFLGFLAFTFHVFSR